MGHPVFVQNVGTHLSDYMSEPGYHIMNVHCFESLISYTFTHSHTHTDTHTLFIFIFAAVYVTFILSNSFYKGIKI